MIIPKDLSIEQLRKAVSIKEEIESLEAKLADIMGDGVPAPSGPISTKGRGVYKRSRAARAAMAATQKARWAKIKGEITEAAPKKRRKMSAAAKAKIAAAARARWKKAKAAGKSTL